MNDASKNISEIINRWFMEDPIFFITQCMFKVQFDETIKTVAVSSKNVFINKSFAGSLTKDELDSVLRLEYLRILLKHPYERFIDDARKDIVLLASEIVISLLYDKKRNVPFHTIDLRQTLIVNRIDVNSFMESFNASMSYEEIYRLLSYTAQKNKIDEYKILGHDDPLDETKYWSSDATATSSVTRVIEHVLSSGGKCIGSMPGNVVEAIKITDKPFYDYTEVLRRFRRSVVSSSKRLTRMRPSRRYGYEQMGSVFDYISNVLVVCDTSGSISQDELNVCINIANGLFSSGLASCDIIQFDTRIIDSTICTMRRRIYEFEVTGRGGTDVGDIKKYIKNRTKNRYDGIIVFSDGLFDFRKQDWIGLDVPIVLCVTEYIRYKELVKLSDSIQNFEVTYIDAYKYER